jgi:hypothetical protein
MLAIRYAGPQLANSDYPALKLNCGPVPKRRTQSRKPLGRLMAEIIKLVSEWAALAHRVSATQDQIGGQQFIRRSTVMTARRLRL